MRMDILNGIEVESQGPRHTQVYLATHKGEQYLPFMNRSFISFSYGGKNIEDFNLIATIEGDRLSRDAYGSFDDLTTTYDALPGQFYWNSYFRTNILSLQLSTDGITQNQLDDFKHWFQPGPGKELILAEHPNRAVIARINEPPQLNLLPFEQKTTIKIGNQTYPTSTTLYKGDIQLVFVMDEPFWYARQNILGNQDVLQGFYSEEWIDANGQVVEVRNTSDALKIIYEDRIPLGSTTNVSVFLGGNVFATVVYKLNSYIVSAVTAEEYAEGIASADPDQSSAYFDNGDTQFNNTPLAAEPDMQYYFPRTPDEENLDEYNKYYKGAVIATIENGSYVSGGRIGGAELTTMDENTSGVTLMNSEKANLYYAGTAPSPLKIKFQLTPIIDDSGVNKTYMIISPNNKHSNTDKPYNTIIFKATREHHFNFSLPGIYTAYNQVIQIFDEFVRPRVAWLTIREYIRDMVKHPIIRAWANCVINRFDTAEKGGQIADTIDLDKLKMGMKYLFCDGSGQLIPARFEFDGKTGKAQGTFTLRNPKDVTWSGDDESQSEATIWNGAGWNGAENLITLVEDVGDMVKSNYLILDERNVLDDSFQVQSWSESHPDYAYEITHNLANSLEHLQFEFKNLYL